MEKEFILFAVFPSQNITRAFVMSPFHCTAAKVFDYFVSVRVCWPFTLFVGVTEIVYCRVDV